MKFLVCLALFVAAASAGVVAPITTTYSAAVPAYATYAAPAYTTYAAAAPAYTSSVYSAVPAYTSSVYSAAAPAYTTYAAAPAVAAYTAPVVYSTLLKKK